MPCVGDVAPIPRRKVDTAPPRKWNSRRDPRVAIGVADPAAPARYWALRGSVVDISTAGAREHIDELSRKYLGRPYPGFGGGGQQRVLLTVKVDRVHTP
ncbi:hypothetical protein ACWCHM_24785 [Micromonospora sp. SCSIO 07396]